MCIRDRLDSSGARRRDPEQVRGSLAMSQTGWYARPVLFVADLHRALRFYVDLLGFRKKWHEGDGAGTVCQVDRGECEIILCEHPTRRDKARLFVELNVSELADLRRELEARSVPSKETW